MYLIRWTVVTTFVSIEDLVDTGNWEVHLDEDSLSNHLDYLNSNTKERSLVTRYFKDIKVYSCNEIVYPIVDKEV